MLFFGKENIFMCLVTFQKIFWKKFSIVWRRRRKRQTRQTQKKDGAIALRSSRSLSMATIDDRDRQARSLDDCTAHRSRRWSIDERACRTIAPLVDRCSPIWALSSLSLSSDLGSLSLSLSGNELKWKWGCKFISGSKA